MYEARRQPRTDAAARQLDVGRHRRKRRRGARHRTEDAERNGRQTGGGASRRGA